MSLWFVLQVWNVFRMEWEQFHNTGEWRAVKDVSVELSEPMLLSPDLIAARLPAADYLRRLALLRLNLAILAANDAIRRRVVGPTETRDLESLIGGGVSMTLARRGSVMSSHRMSCSVPGPDHNMILLDRNGSLLASPSLSTPSNSSVSNSSQGSIDTVVGADSDHNGSQAQLSK